MVEHQEAYKKREGASFGNSSSSLGGFRVELWLPDKEGLEDSDPRLALAEQEMESKKKKKKKSGLPWMALGDLITDHRQSGGSLFAKAFTKGSNKQDSKEPDLATLASPTRPIRRTRSRSLSTVRNGSSYSLHLSGSLHFMESDNEVSLLDNITKKTSSPKKNTEKVEDTRFPLDNSRRSGLPKNSKPTKSLADKLGQSSSTLGSSISNMSVFSSTLSVVERREKRLQKKAELGTSGHHIRGHSRGRLRGRGRSSRVLPSSDFEEGDNELSSDWANESFTSFGRMRQRRRSKSMTDLNKSESALYFSPESASGFQARSKDEKSRVETHKNSREAYNGKDPGRSAMSQSTPGRVQQRRRSKSLTDLNRSDTSLSLSDLGPDDEKAEERKSAKRDVYLAAFAAMSQSAPGRVQQRRRSKSLPDFNKSDSVLNYTYSPPQRQSSSKDKKLGGDKKSKDKKSTKEKGRSSRRSKSPRKESRRSKSPKKKTSKSRENGQDKPPAAAMATASASAASAAALVANAAATAASLVQNVEQQDLTNRELEEIQAIAAATEAAAKAAQTAQELIANFKNKRMLADASSDREGTERTYESSASTLDGSMPSLRRLSSV